MIVNMGKILFIQAIGAIGYGVLALSYYEKEKRQILFMQIFAYIFFTIHYYLLSGITGAICNFIGLGALITIYIFDKYKFKKKSLITSLFILLLFIINIISFQNIFSIFPMLASIIVLISFLDENENSIRGIGVVAALCWLVYAIAYKSYIAIIFEIVTLIGVGVAFLKNLYSRQTNKKVV